MKTFFKLLSPCLMFLLMLGSGNEVIAQSSLSASINDPLNVAIPYLNYQDISDKEIAMRTWVKDNPKACATYVRQVTEAIKSLDRDSLNPREEYFVKRREYECKKLTKLTHKNQ